MSYRTNRRTRGVFKIGNKTAFRRTVAKNNLPAETKEFRDYARAVGLKARIQQKKILSLKWRGFPEGEEIVNNDRLEYIRNHLDTIPLIVIDGKTGDIVDGNHRYRVYKELGFKTVPVLALSGPEAGFDAIEDFSQNWNNGARWEELENKPYEAHKIKHVEKEYQDALINDMSNGIRCEYCGNTRDKCSCIVGGLKSGKP